MFFLYSFLACQKVILMLNFIPTGICWYVYNLMSALHDHSQQVLVLSPSFVDGQYLSIPAAVPGFVSSSPLATFQAPLDLLR